MFNGDTAFHDVSHKCGVGGEVCGVGDKVSLRDVVGCGPSGCIGDDSKLGGRVRQGCVIDTGRSQGHQGM